MRLPGEFVFQHGTIVDVRGNRAWVAITPDDQLSGCAGCGRCTGGFDTRVPRVPVKVSEVLPTGQRVTVERFIPNPAVSAGFLFGLPLVFSLTVLTIWATLMKGTLESLGGFCIMVSSLAVGLLLAGLSERLFLPREPNRIVDTPAATPGCSITR